jgi:hypothetical protein
MQHFDEENTCDYHFRGKHSDCTKNETKKERGMFSTKLKYLMMNLERY